MQLGFLSLLPIIVFFVLVFTTKRMIMSLNAGLLLACILLSGTGFLSSYLGFIQESFMGGTAGYLFLLLALFGVLIILLDKTGAALGFANWVSKFANTKKKALILAYIIGIVTFVDDYLHEMSMGTAMRPVTDRFRISRSKLAFLNNFTASTICILVPISTWGAFYAGLYESTGVCAEGAGMSTYIASIPFMFYGIFALLIALLVSIGLFPDLGMVKKQEKLAQETGIVCPKERSNENEDIMAAEETEETEKKNANPIPFLLSLVAIIAATMIWGDVCIGCCAAIVFMIVYSLLSKQLTWNEILDTSTEGVKSMFSVCFVIAVAIAFTAANTAIGMSDYLVGILTPILQSSAALFPAIAFTFLVIHGFFAGGAWTQSMIFMPVIVPIGIAIGANPLLIAAACVSGSAFSSSLYIGADATLLVSASTEVTPKGVIDAELPYAIVACVLSIIAFVIAGFIM
ncbi:MAG: hypothetical protein IJ744_04205 [Lachnospiraceae bacterium]|nr:hypothetical protein [Lachnospiraceae bacterium]